MAAWRGSLNKASVPAVGEADVSPSNICQIGWGVAGSFRSAYWRLLVRGCQLNPQVYICTWLLELVPQVERRAACVLWVLVELRVRVPETIFSSSCNNIGLWWQRESTVICVFSKGINRGCPWTSHPTRLQVQWTGSVWLQRDVVLRYHRFLDKHCFNPLRAP